MGGNERSNYARQPGTQNMDEKSRKQHDTGILQRNVTFKLQHGLRQMLQHRETGIAY